MMDYLFELQVVDLIKYVDEINLKYGVIDMIMDLLIDKVCEIEKCGYVVGLKLLCVQVCYLGIE